MINKKVILLSLICSFAAVNATQAKCRRVCSAIIRNSSKRVNTTPMTSCGKKIQASTQAKNNSSTKQTNNKRSYSCSSGMCSRR